MKGYNLFIIFKHIFFGVTVFAARTAGCSKRTLSLPKVINGNVKPVSKSRTLPARLHTRLPDVAPRANHRSLGWIAHDSFGSQPQKRRGQPAVRFHKWQLPPDLAQIESFQAGESVITSETVRGGSRRTFALIKVRLSVPSNQGRR